MRDGTAVGGIRFPRHCEWRDYVLAFKSVIKLPLMGCYRALPSLLIGLGNGMENKEHCNWPSQEFWCPTLLLRSLEGWK